VSIIVCVYTCYCLIYLDRAPRAVDVVDVELVVAYVTAPRQLLGEHSR
jgi:hypothetical protein